jgi:uncharacterized protein (TIGR02246 family)
MKLLSCAVLMLAVFTFAACAPPPEEVVVEEPDTTEADIAAVEQIAVDWNAAYAAEDVEALVSFFTDDAVRIPANEPALIGKDAVRTWFQGQFDQFIVDTESTLVDVRVSGDLAYFWGTWAGSNTPREGGQPVEANGSFVGVAERQADGSWKTIFNSWSMEQLELPPMEE